jgi:galactokinase
MFSNFVSKKITKGRIHSSAIAIFFALVLAYIGGRVTGGSKGLADVTLFTGVGVLGASTLRDFTIVATSFGAKLSELNEKLEELENSGKSEAEKAKAASDKELAKLQKQVADLTKERDEAKENFAKSERTSKIAKLAAKHSFSDAEYLDYLTNAKQLDLDDDTATAEYMKELGKSKPELFKSTAKPGGGTGTGGKAVSSAKERMDELMKKDSLTTREADEVIELQQKIQAEGSGEANNKGE